MPLADLAGDALDVAPLLLNKIIRCGAASGRIVEVEAYRGADDPERATQAARALASVAARQRGRTLRVETVDGEPARVSPHADVLRSADFRSDVRGLSLEAPR